MRKITDRTGLLEFNDEPGVAGAVEQAGKIGGRPADSALGDDRKRVERAVKMGTEDGRKVASERGDFLTDQRGAQTKKMRGVAAGLDDREIWLAQYQQGAAGLN